MIEFEQITKTYQMGDETIHALNHVDMKIKAHEFVAVIGPSGSGKTTLMNIVGCLDSPDEGRYMLDGEDVSELTDNELARVRNEKIGFVFQQFNLLSKLTAYENVELPLIYQNLGAAERRQRVNEALERVGLSGRMKHKPTELSGGQQQRVAIARAIATRPALILADEPTGNLDSKSSAEIMAMLTELNEQNNTIVLITHDAEVANAAKRQIAIHDGILTHVERAVAS